VSSTGEKCQADIVCLTKAAAEAAELGQWDVVAQYYRERGALLVAMESQVQPMSDVLKLDGQMLDRVSTVQAVLASLMREAAVTRQRLRSLHRKVAVQSADSMTVSMKA
jgi:hypothetical protein